MIEQNKVYTIDTCKEIPCLGGITGPVTTPVRIEHNDLVWLLKNGYTVYQCNPYDSSEKVLVTRSNINTIEFKRNRAVVTSQRMLNRSIQDMDKPIMVDVVKKDNSNKKNDSYKNEKKEDLKRPPVSASNTSSEKVDNKGKQNESTESNTVTDDNKSTKVTTPDGFSK